MRLLFNILKILIPFFLGVGIATYYFLKPKSKSADGWTVAEKQLPLPTHTSSAFSEQVKNGEVPNYNARQVVPPSKAAWKKFLASAEATRAKGIQKQISDLKVQVDSLNIDGVVTLKENL